MRQPEAYLILIFFGYLKKKKIKILESTNEFFIRPCFNYPGGCLSLLNSQPAWTAVGPVLHGFVLGGWEHSENIALRTFVSHCSTCWRRKTGLVISTKWICGCQGCVAILWPGQQRQMDQLFTQLH